MKKTELLKEELSQLSLEYSNGSALLALAKKYRIGLTTVKKIITDSGGSIKKSVKARDGFNNEAFKDFNQEIQAYIYGFTLGDGCLHFRMYKDTLNKSIVFGVNPKDREVLETIKGYLKSENKVSERTFVSSQTGKTHSTCTFSFTDNAVIERLEAEGLSPRKSGVEKLPSDVLSNNRHFWRGLVDADGSLSFTKGNSAILNLVGSLELVNGLAAFVKKSIDVTMKISKHSKSNVFYASVTGDNARKIAKLLYDKSAYHLNRKKQRAEIMQQDLDTPKVRVCTAKPKQLLNGLWNVRIGLASPKSTVSLLGFKTEEEALNARDSYINDLNLKTKEIHDAIATS